MSRARSRSWRPLSAVVAALALAGLAGCYGSTEPATNVGPEGAQLNARGTANNGPARGHFEYWITGSPRIRGTYELHFPAGASGPFSQKVAGLAASTSYSFRVCGRDESAANDVCVQTLTFKTSAPVQDSAVGSWANSPGFNGSVNAHSGPAGQNPTGSVSAQLPVAAFNGSVTCLRVGANRAAVGAVGQQIDHDQQASAASLLLTIVDGGPSSNDKMNVRTPQAGSTPPNCATASFGQEGDVYGELVVNDAP